MFPFALWAFGRLPRAAATSLVVLTGSLFLPEKIAFDMPAVPPMDKEYITYLSALIAAYSYRRSSIASARPGAGPEILIVLMLLANMATASVNSVPMMDEGRLEDGLGFYWVLASTGDDLLGVAIPFLLGRAMFRTVDDLRALFTYMAKAALLMTVLIMIEVVMSIPFHVWQFSQVLYGVPMRPMDRYGLIQPIVFMDNGLSLASFMACAAIAAAGLKKAGLRVGRWRGGKARNVILFGLLSVRNVAAIVYGFTMGLFCWALRPRSVGRLASALALFSCVYPVLRLVDVFPDHVLVETARSLDEDRADSLLGRFEEEDFVLGGIGDRLWLGWGTISRVPGAETFGRGEVGIDGWWTIRVGVSGITGFLLHYAFFAVPMFLAWRRLRGLLSSQATALLAALMAMVAIRMIDLLINGWWNSLPVFLAGAVYGVAQARAPRRARARSNSAATGRPVGVH